MRVILLVVMVIELGGCSPPAEGNRVKYEYLHVRYIGITHTDKQDPMDITDHTTIICSGPKSFAKIHISETQVRGKVLPIKRIMKSDMSFEELSSKVGTKIRGKFGFLNYLGSERWKMIDVKEPEPEHYETSGGKVRSFSTQDEYWFHRTVL